MDSTHEAKGPQFVEYFGPVLVALRKLGGSAKPNEVREIVARLTGISQEEQDEVLPSGTSRYGNRVAWARFYLAKAGLLDSSRRGVWALTDSGANKSLSLAEAHSMFTDIHQKFASDRKERAKENTDPSEEVAPGSTGEDASLLDIIKKVSADGFERLCQRLLRESGFEQVTVTGRSGDGGIDGHGLLQVNPFVSFQVIFQCKRYKSAVDVGVIRDFRGSMMGRADKGIIISTGTFTKPAREEATRDGVPPIELVDGEKLVDLFEKLELGLSPRINYDIDFKFFEQFGYRPDGNGATS